ncbi:hypothetical protein PN36_15925 [Candidatus Thiomargarita nelsonii]|uniref:Uncharacterized protein n=1 Tax=Candidatus Thiomargarita nelsonii TaxID=1003181 RepID=A0A0A6PBR9_9GAMM|nr:hypothetical protein PN36_15925 [Candidatus Thiomargarita nelsonii]
MIRKSLFVALLISFSGVGYADPPSVTSAGFQTVSDEVWDEAAVGRVLHTFAYGGQIRESTIEKLANMSPEEAIKKILTFKKSNRTISKPAKTDTAKLWKKTNGTLRGLGEFWSSDDPDNDVPEDRRYKYAVDESYVRVGELWLRAAVCRGLNPVRQKLGLWETNYHMAVNLDSSVNYQQMLTYYDDIMKSLGKSKRPYHQTLSIAATSAAVAQQYGHRNNLYIKGECKCNEDFAREYHQLFFGILGNYDPVYHEEITIKNTAKALTHMTVERIPDVGYADYVLFGTKYHYPGELDILYSLNNGKKALKRIQTLSQVAIYHEESRQNLPVIIVQGLADDQLSESDIAEIRAAWDSMAEKNLLAFLQAYAISTQFHDPSRVKYLSSLDRVTLINNQFILNNAEIERYSLNRYLSEEQAYPFYPTHDVFGGQTGTEAADSLDVFIHHYNLATDNNYVFLNVADDTWRKDWASVIPKKSTKQYEVDKVGEFLWKRFIGDGLKNYGTLERTYVNSLLATTLDFAYNVNSDEPDRVFTTEELETEPDLIALRTEFANQRMTLKGFGDPELQEANRRIGFAVSFIVGTPYIFAQEGR